MKKILLPIAFFAAVALSACGDDEIEATCDASDKDLVENCDISGAETCVEENGDVHYISIEGPESIDEYTLADLLAIVSTYKLEK